MITLDTINKDLHSIVIDDGGGSITVDGSVAISGNVTVDQGTSPWVIGDGGGSITVDASALDIRQLASGTDSVSAVQSGAWTVGISGNVTVDQGTSPWVIGDGGGSITVDAVDLDIRNLVFADDKVDVSGSSVSISALSGQYAEDSAHSSGAMGNFIMGVRNDSNAVLTSADGDYSPISVSSSGAVRTTVNFSAANGGSMPTGNAVIAGYDGANVRAIKTDAAGELQVDVLTLPAITATDLDIRDLSYLQDSVQIKDAAGDALAINADGSINVQTVEAGYGSWKVSTASVGVTEVQLVSTPLANRLRIEIQNLGSKDVWIKEATGVSTANGIKIPKGSSYEQALDAGSSIYAISDGASADLRIAEYAA